MSTEFDNEQITQAFGQLAEIEKEFEQSEVEIREFLFFLCYNLPAGILKF